MKPLALLLLTACANPGQTFQELVTPDAFHVYYSDGEGNSSGSVGSPRDPNRFQSESHSDFNSWTAGLSWDLIGPGKAKAAANDALDAAKRQMRAMAQLAAEAAVEIAMARLDDDVAEAVRLLRKLVEDDG